MRSQSSEYCAHVHVLEDSLLRSTCDLYMLLMYGLMSDICEILEAIVSLRDVLDLNAWTDVYGVLVSDQ